MGGYHASQYGQHLRIVKATDCPRGHGGHIASTERAMFLYLVVGAFALFTGVVAFLSIEDAIRFPRR